VIRDLFKISSLLFFFMCSQSLSEARQEIVAIQSIRVAPYEQALNGFKSVCHANITRLVVSELRDADVAERIDEIRPDMVLAIGMDALSRVRGIKDTPIMYLMVLNSRSIPSGERNITGVSMYLSPETQVLTMLEILPKAKTVGLLYDPQRTGHLVKKARYAAERNGIELIAAEVHDPKEVPPLMEAMRGKIDIFWMLPDLTVITPETLEFLLLFSLENSTPILSFSEKYVELGALMSVGIDAFDIGRQAGEMADAILSGKGVMDIHRADARKAVISINLKVARKLGIIIDEGTIRKARVID
jgi:putative ABC transport system substrate-binding protein